ncbi:MAG: hypothetical protein HQL72_09310 [Magnetococcales bacterium]|nr:hypothetical protein [Magnetococcales bacterium]
MSLLAGGNSFQLGNGRFQVQQCVRLLNADRLDCCMDGLENGHIPVM